MDKIEKELFDGLIKKEASYEMAYDRPDAIDRCSSLGKRFVEHFITTCKDGINSKDFKHRCQEMQSWWDDVKGIKLKESKKLISISALNDWFFTLGRDPEDFIPEEYLSIYSLFYLSLLSDRDNAKVEDVLTKLLTK